MNLEPILNSGLRFSIVDGRLSVRGSAALVKEFQRGIVQWKPELLKITADETVDDVGGCGHCGADLLGLLVHGGYINRVCPVCGEWAVCLPPDWTPEDVQELIEERIAIMQHDGGLSPEVAEIEGCDSVKQQIEQQRVCIEQPMSLFLEVAADQARSTAGNNH